MRLIINLGQNIDDTGGANGGRQVILDTRKLKMPLFVATNWKLRTMIDTLSFARRISEVVPGVRGAKLIRHNLLPVVTLICA